jgi:hypothetical protein
VAPLTVVDPPSVVHLMVVAVLVVEVVALTVAPVPP